MSRTKKHVVEIGGKWYYYDTCSTLRGPYEKEENAIKALRAMYEQYGKELE